MGHEIQDRGPRDNGGSPAFARIRNGSSSRVNLNRWCEETATCHRFRCYDSGAARSASGADLCHPDRETDENAGFGRTRRSPVLSPQEVWEIEAGAAMTRNRRISGLQPATGADRFIVIGSQAVLSQFDAPGLLV
jgi:hypothetical protein